MVIETKCEHVSACGCVSYLDNRGRGGEELSVLCKVFHSQSSRGNYQFEGVTHLGEEGEGGRRERRGVQQD